MKIFLILLSLIIHSPSYSQRFDSILLTGSKVPDIVFPNVINYHSNNISLSDFKGKLVILDFWATWCTSCIYTFPKLDSLQKEFAGDVQFILINNSKGTGDNKEDVEQFIRKYQSGNRKIPAIPIVVEDTLTQSYFPYMYIPHYVWISAKGKLLAFTGSKFVTRNVIEKLLKEE